MVRRTPPKPRERTFFTIAIVLIAVDGVVNLVLFERSRLLAVAQLLLAAWLAWRIWWAPRPRR